MAITIGAVHATVNGAYMKAYTVTSGVVGADTTADLAHGGVVNFAGVAVAPNFLMIVDTDTAKLAVTDWAVAPTVGSETTKITVRRIPAANTSATATVYIGYLHTIAKGQAT